MSMESAFIVYKELGEPYNAAGRRWQPNVIYPGGLYTAASRATAPARPVTNSIHYIYTDYTAGCRIFITGRSTTARGQPLQSNTTNNTRAKVLPSSKEPHTSDHFLFLFRRSFQQPKSLDLNARRFKSPISKRKKSIYTHIV